MSMQDRLKEARKSRTPKTTQADIAKLCGVTVQAVSGWERGEAKPETDKLLKIAAFLGVTVDWLLDPDGEPKLIRPSGTESTEVEKVSEGWPDVGNEWMDVHGVTAGGKEGFFYFGDVIDQVRRPPGIRNARNVAALNVIGDSMVPRFRPGELIYVQLREPSPGDDVVVELYPENEGDAPRSFLKELTSRTGRQLTCTQHNPKRPITFDRGEVNRLWRVLTLRELLG